MNKLKQRKRLARKVNRVMAYIYVPLLFSFIVYGTVYAMTSDMLSILKNAINLITSDKAPGFNNQSNNSFVPNEIETNVQDGIETVKREEVPISEYGDLYANIACDRIALDAPVYKGDDESILKSGIGQNFASSQPGFGRLILLGGHNNTYFNALKNIEVNDVIKIETSYGTYSYSVTETKVLEESDKSAYDYNVDHERLVLYTCYPFDMLSRTNYRFFVYADLISGPVLTD